jgi:hypothetical protein
MKPQYNITICYLCTIENFVQLPYTAVLFWFIPLDLQHIIFLYSCTTDDIRKQMRPFNQTHFVSFVSYFFHDFLEKCIF